MSQTATANIHALNLKSSGNTNGEKRTLPDLAATRSSVGAQVKAFLKGCGLSYPQLRNHVEFEEECVLEAVRRGYMTDDNRALRPFLTWGAAMARNAYPHQSYEIQVFICFYTAFLLYMDDTFEGNVEPVRRFVQLFVTGQKQAVGLLDRYAEFLLDMPRIFGTVEANIMLASTIHLVTALLVEHEFENVKLEPSAYKFPYFIRVMSGASEVYTMFIFPPEIPLKWKLQAQPDCMIYINHGNDILSFYKEELAGDTVNQVSLTAQCLGVTSDVVLGELVEDGAKSHLRLLEILAPHKEALAAYESFALGYVGFHAAIGRYRLHELDLNDE
ncbi:hypothetical protein diail_4943 [Diaporthe ilicicola]|nr:hypothetical protein diail_4943 [Diaporthe ilicicola]